LLKLSFLSPFSPFHTATLQLQHYSPTAITTTIAQGHNAVVELRDTWRANATIHVWVISVLSTMNAHRANIAAKTHVAYRVWDILVLSTQTVVDPTNIVATIPVTKDRVLCLLGLSPP
jgi:hypothetical protein